MSSKLPVNNSQTITEFLNLHLSQISEEDSDDSYKFAFDDEAFLARRETMGIRFELELLKPEVLLKENGIEHTITVFGSARFVSHEQALELKQSAKTVEEIALANMALLHSEYYESAREFGREPDPQEANAFTQRVKSQTLTGEKWCTLSGAMQSDSPLTNTLRFCAELDALSRQALQSQLRQTIHFHCGMGTLKTRQFMMDIQAL